MNVYRLLKFEIKKLFNQPIAYAGIIIVALVCIVFCVLNVLNRPPDAYSGVLMMADVIDFQNNILLLPLVAILVAAHSVSEEISTGTLRTLITKPVKRENIVAGKVLSVFVYLCCTVYLTMIIAVLFGLRWGYPEDAGSFILKLVLVYFVYVLVNMVLVAFTIAVCALGAKPTLTGLAAVGFHIIILIAGQIRQVQELTYIHHVSKIIQTIMGMSLEGMVMYKSLAIIMIYILALLLVATTLWEKRDINA